MKLWKGIGKKAGHFGTMDDDGFVPDSVSCTQQEYDVYVAAQPVIVVKKSLTTLLKEKGIITQIEYDEVK